MPNGRNDLALQFAIQNLKEENGFEILNLVISKYLMTGCDIPDFAREYFKNFKKRNIRRLF